MDERQTITYPMLERISKIHKKIAAGCYPNTKALSYDLDVSVATISRDIECMRDRLRAPIEYDRAQNGYYYYEPYEMPVYSLSAHDAAMLASAKQLLSAFKHTPLYEEACGIIELLSQSVMPLASPSLLNRIALAPSPRANISKEAWNAVCAAMQQNRVIEFDYTGRYSGVRERRRVQPYQLLLDEGVCYLFGYAEERCAERLFVLSRMERITVTADEFTLPADFDFAQRCGGGKFGAFCKGKRERCTVAFYGDARAWVRECVWADDQQLTEDDEAGTTTITFTSSQTERILEWVLSRGANAVPLEPARLVAAWREHAEAMATAE